MEVQLRTINSEDSVQSAVLKSPNEKPIVSASDGELDYVCPRCRTVLLKGFGSLTHLQLLQVVFECACGSRLRLPVDERANGHEDWAK